MDGAYRITYAIHHDSSWHPRGRWTPARFRV